MNNKEELSWDERQKKERIKAAKILAVIAVLGSMALLVYLYISALASGFAHQ